MLLKSIYLLISLTLFISCSEDKPTNNNIIQNNEIPAMKASIDGSLKFAFESQNFNYINYQVLNYTLYEIEAKGYNDTTAVEIRITFRDYDDGTKSFDFDTDTNQVILTYATLPLGEIYNKNVSGTLNIVNFSENHISATFDFTATTVDPKNKIVVKDGIINYTRK